MMSANPAAVNTVYAINSVTFNEEGTEQLPKSYKIRNRIMRQLIAEFSASFILVFMIDCVIASSTLLDKPVDLFGICVTAGVALYLALMVGAAAGAGHSTPIVTVALATLNKFPWQRVPAFVAVHYLGGVAAALLTFANYYNAIESYGNGKRTTFGNDSTALIFTSFPAKHTTAFSSLLDQFICCALTMYAVMLLIDEKHPYFSKYAAKPAIGFLLCAVVMCFELNAGAAINPPRDLVGRIFLYFAGYGTEPFTILGGYYWWTAGLLGPHLGAIAGAWIYYLSIEMHHEDIVVHPLK